MSIANSWAKGSKGIATLKVYTAYLYTNTHTHARFDCVLPASCQFHCQDIEARKLVYRKSGFRQTVVAAVVQGGALRLQAMPENCVWQAVFGFAPLEQN